MNKSAVKQVLAISCVVAAVAALLAAPIANATNASNKQLCQNNLRVIWRALKAYQQDYMGFPLIDNGIGGPGWRTWFDWAMPYGLTAQDGTCPSQDLQTENWARTPWGGGPYPHGYAINSNLSLDYPPPGPLGMLPVNYDHYLLVADGYWAWFAYDDSEDPKGLRFDSPNWWSNKVAWRHPKPAPYSSTNAATNFLTGSGHVICLKKFINTSQFTIGGRESGFPSSISSTSMGMAAKEAVKR